jgi:hypothetical protein
MLAKDMASAATLPGGPVTVGDFSTYEFHGMPFAADQPVEEVKPCKHTAWRCGPRMKRKPAQFLAENATVR